MNRYFSDNRSLKLDRGRSAELILYREYGGLCAEASSAWLNANRKSVALDLEKSTGVSVCGTHCPYCALQCGMNLEPTGQHSWSVVERDFPTDRGGLCQKGWTAVELIEDAARPRTPLVRDRCSEPLRAATWEDALERTRCTIGTRANHRGQAQPFGAALRGGNGAWQMHSWPWRRRRSRLSDLGHNRMKR
jgi:anaerobic selenocysteine-containing dehydrogenase